MKNKKILLAAVACLGISAGVLTGCGGSNPNREIISVKMYNGGHGRGWFDDICSKFVSYKKAKDGKDVAFSIECSKNVGTTVYDEITNPISNDVDLYLVNGQYIHELIKASYNILGTDEVALLEPLDETVLDKKGIRFDGTEETKTIKSRLFDGYEEATKYHSVTENSKWEDRIFTISWSDCLTGVIYNPAILELAGVSTLPLTSDQFIQTVEDLYNYFTTEELDISPFIYSGKEGQSGAPGYWNYLYNTWFSQYSGYEGFNKFQACIPESLDIENDGWEVYKEPGIEKALEPMFELMNEDYMVPSCDDADYGTAQTSFAIGDAAFMCNGDWILREMQDQDQQYYDLMKDFQMMKTPILSSIGPEVGLSTDEELAQLVGLIDQHKTHAQILTEMSETGLTDDGITRVENARGAHSTEGVAHQVLVPSYADKKDLSLEFLRFMYSEDGCKTFNKYTYCNLPFYYQQEQQVGVCDFQKSVNAMYDYDNVSMVDAKSSLNEVRPMGGFFFFNNEPWNGDATTFKTIMKQKDTQKWTAKHVAEKELEKAETKWPTWMKQLDW